MTSAASSLDAYTGVDNLEVMAEAANYNSFLLGLVTAQLAPGDLVLDFGAGTGAFAAPLAAAGNHIVCVEPDHGLRARLSAAGFEAREHIGPVAPESLDFIYSINVLEHIKDDLGALAQLRDRLKPGGTLLVYVPAFPCLFSSMDRKVGHVRRYRRAALATSLEQCGFRVERIAYQDSLGFFASLLFKIIGNADGTINRRAVIAYDRWVFPLSRWLDRVVGRWFGKNLVALAYRQD
jgi:SAM-dependent methyltransferase